MNAGRKRKFDKDEALDKAMRVFWNNGYTGTSITDLTSALGINKPSLYAAFGNKEKLFESSIEHYMLKYGLPKIQQLKSPSDIPLKERLKEFLYGLIDMQTNPKTPSGCFFVKSSCESGGNVFPSEMSLLIGKFGLNTEQFITDFLESERKQGNISEQISIKDAARHLISVMYGLAVQARGGKSKETLKSTADFAVSIFPSKD